MNRAAAVLLALVGAGGIAQPAQAFDSLTCAQAMSLVQSHPGIEADSIATTVMQQWQAMDRRTVAGGHPAIAGEMIASPSAMNALTVQCEVNPGQRLGLAAAQIYHQAREQLDGF